jgi:tetratricopeptide (TPR) repeat protein
MENGAGAPERAGSARLRARLLLLLPLVAGLSLRAFSLLRYRGENPFATHLFSDAHHYLEWARLIAVGTPPPEPFYQAPLYPYLLATLLRLFGENLAALYALQLLLGGASIVLLTLIGRTFLPATVAAIAATLYALLPYPVHLEEKLFPETTAIVLSLLAVHLSLGRVRTARKGLAAGFAAGAASLSRATLLPVGLLFFVYRCRRGRREGAAFGVAFLLTIAPAFVHNFRSGGGLVLIAANGGEVFAHGNNPNSRGSMGRVPGLRPDIETLAGESRRVASARAGREQSAAEASSFWFREGFRYIRSAPADYLRLEIRKVRLLLSARFVPLGSYFDFESARFPGIPRLLAFLQYPLLLFAAVGLLRAESRRRIPFPLAAYAAVQAAVPLVFFVSTRYAATVLPALALYAGAGLAFGIGGRGRVVAAALAPFVVLLAIADAGTDTVYAVPYAELASIRSAEGRRGEAAALYEEAVRISPLELRHYQNLAREREEGGDVAGAAEAIGRAARAGLADGRTLGYYGSLLARLGRDREAEAALREAIRVEPGRSRSRFELGALLERTGRTAEAMAEYREAIRLNPNDPDPARALEALERR